MILSFVGKTKYLSNKELREIISNPLVNGIFKRELVIELQKRKTWQNDDK